MYHHTQLVITSKKTFDPSFDMLFVKIQLYERTQWNDTASKFIVIFVPVLRVHSNLTFFRTGGCCLQAVGDSNVLNANAR